MAMRIPKKNPYERCRYVIPGYQPAKKTDQIHLTGPRAVIAQALTYYGLPPNIEFLNTMLEQLPGNETINELPQIQRYYLSFTLYSLKQMMAANSIDPAAAWSFYYWDRDNIARVTVENYQKMREAFWSNVREYLNDSVLGKMDLLELELLVRGNRSAEAFKQWKMSFLVLPWEVEEVPEPIKIEYRKVIWLEMMQARYQAGFSVNGLIDRFHLISMVEEGRYSDRMVHGRVDLLLPLAIDAIIKSEIGHWLIGVLDVFNETHMLEYRWMSELWDRMYASGFAPEPDMRGENPDSDPVSQVFWNGGNFISSTDFHFPAFLQDFPSVMEIVPEKHVQAERFEKLMRNRLKRAVLTKEIKQESAFELYWKFGMYLTLVAFECLAEGREDFRKHAIARIEEFDLEAICSYHANFKDLAVKALTDFINNNLADAIEGKRPGRADARYRAAKAIIKLQGLEKNSPEYDQLSVHLNLVASSKNKLVQLFQEDPRLLQALLNDCDDTNAATARMAQDLLSQKIT